jgi:hypothetical protein
MRDRQSPALPSRWTSLILAAAFSVTLAGCGNEDPNSVTIRTASYRLDALSPQSGVAASNEYVAQQCQQIIQDLRPVISNGNATQKAAANSLVARAQFSVAFPKIQNARVIQATTQSQIEISRSLYARLLVQRALETAANNYDPAPELAEIDREIARVAQQVTAAQASKAQVDAAVSSLRAKAGTKRSESQTFREAEASLRQQVLTTEDYDEAARLMVQTQDARRRADALDVEASDLEAQADQRAPESIEIERQIQRFQNEAALLAESRREVIERGQRAKGDAASAAADATETQSLLTTALADLASTYTSQMLPAVDDAVSTLNQASAAANQARSVIQPVKGVQAESQQTIGDLQWAAAELSEGYAGLTQTLAETAPPLPGLGDLTAAHQAASQSFTDRIRLAAEALNIAADAINDQQVADSLRQRANAFSARAGDPVTPPDDEDPFDPDQSDPASGDAGDEVGG